MRFLKKKPIELADFWYIHSCQILQMAVSPSRSSRLRTGWAGGISHDNARFRFLPGLFEGKKKCPTSPYQQPSNNYNQGYRPPSNNYNNQGYRPPNNYNNNYRPPTSSYNSNQSYRPPQTSYASQPSSTYQSSSNYRPPSNYQSSYTPPSNNYQSSQYRDPIPPLSYPSRG